MLPGPCVSSDFEKLALHLGASVFSSAKWECQHRVPCQTADSRWRVRCPSLSIIFANQNVSLGLRSWPWARHLGGKGAGF